MSTGNRSLARSAAPRCGIGLRTAHVAEILATRPALGWVEVHAENYMGGGPAIAQLEAVRQHCPVSIHGVGLSLGSAGGVDARHLGRLRELVERIEPWLVSEHLSWSVAGGAYLNHLLPLPYTEEALGVVADNVSRAQEALGRAILVENPSSYLRFVDSPIPEPELLAELVRRTGCGLLCDVNNIAVSAHNLGLDALGYLDALPAAAVGEIHLAGHAANEADGRIVLIDDHGSAVSDGVWALYRRALERFGPVPSLIEWDTDIPALDVLLGEAAAADRILGAMAIGRTLAGSRAAGPHPVRTCARAADAASNGRASDRDWDSVAATRLGDDADAGQRVDTPAAGLAEAVATDPVVGALHPGPSAASPRPDPPSITRHPGAPALPRQPAPPPLPPHADAPSMAPSLRGLSPCLDAPSHARRTGHGPGLGELQAAIRAALLGGDAPAAAGAIAPDGIAPEARLDIYRHHVLTTLTAALETTFPAVVQLVDRRFFAYAADAYIRAEPPAGPCLGEYGRTFPAFLASFPPCRHLAYLPDVARLEWAMSAALHAEDREPLDPAALARVAPDDLPRLVFALDPSAAWIESAWPVDRIWRAARDEAGADVVDVSAGGARLEIRRIDGEVALRALPPADHALRAALAAGATLERAAEAALASDPGFDLAAALGDLLHERILVGCAVSN